MCVYIYIILFWFSLYDIIIASDSGPKLDSMCRLDECRKPKRKLSDGTLREYCCKDHAEKAASNGKSSNPIVNFD